jgi:phosphotransferase system enzyme I (PtsI)
MPRPADRAELEDDVSELAFDGIAGSSGIAVGPAIVLDRRRGTVRRHVTHAHIDDEMDRFEHAVDTAAGLLREALAKSGRSRAEVSILEAYVAMITDETLHDEVERRIRIDFLCAEWALSTTIDEMAEQLGQSSDPYLAERRHDIEFVGQSIMQSLSGHPESILVPKGRDPGVLVAHDLSPAETVTLSRESVLAIVTEVGTRTSHTAILARALEIPAVVGVRDLLARVGDGDTLVVDGLRGRVTRSPAPGTTADAVARAERHRDALNARRSLKDRPILTACGTRIELQGNIELAGEAPIAIEQGARGIGLYRTEFLYVNRKQLPDEDEQYETYRRVLESVSPLPVTLRTFDIGGDKFASSIQLPSDMNPALGLRAIRLALARQDLFLTQLRAIVRASVHGTLRLMVPMVTSMGELREVKRLLTQAIAEVDAAGHARAPHIPLGIMVEVPAAAIMADRFAPEAEFLSIGTNDLVQYTLAVDRSSPALAYLASSYDPSILRLIQTVVRAGAAHGRPVIVCGAMASDPLAVVLLVGMGLRELSLEASSISDVRAALERVTVAEARVAADLALECCTATDVRILLEERFAGIAGSPESG